MKSNALKIDAKDNVAVALQSLKKGEPVVVDGQHLLDTTQDIAAGHKIALAAIRSGDVVVRYGEPIVQATRDIGQGEWVHVHNTRPIPGGTLGIDAH
jgi:altronate hydrolase